MSVDRAFDPDDLFSSPAAKALLEEALLVFDDPRFESSDWAVTFVGWPKDGGKPVRITLATIGLYESEPMDGEYVLLFMRWQIRREIIRRSGAIPGRLN